LPLLRAGFCTVAWFPCIIHEFEQMSGKTKNVRKFIWRWTKRLVLASVALFTVLIISGAIYQFAATRMDEGKYPPPGKMVDVGGFKLHINCIGEGSPTILFENGSGNASTIWNKVVPELSKTTRTCTYDRAGIGWSETSPHARDFDQVNKELADLLTNAGEGGPFVLAGHSLGGIYVQNFANRYPDKVAGVVLIDSTHPEQFIRGIDGGMLVWILRVVKVASPVGIIRIVTNLSSESTPESLQSSAVQNSTKHHFAMANELLNSEVSFRKLSQNPMKLADKPLLVLSRSPNSPMPGAANPEEVQQTWTGLQNELAALAPNSKHITATTAGHMIQSEEPELVIDAIKELLDGLKK
jgi:pimeloyl-ACP methyl ester carboxylesterase